MLDPMNPRHAEIDPRVVAVEAALDQLAAERTPAQVAARLHTDCAIGIRRSFDTCPVAEWLLARTGIRVRVGPDWWAIVDDGWSHSLPDVVAEFVDGFDARRYPQLDDAVPA